jgi:hypothetical protein
MPQVSPPREALALQDAQDRLSDSDFPFRGTGATLRRMTRLAKQERSDRLEPTRSEVGLQAELTLRFGAVRLHGRLHWPQPVAERDRSPLVVLLADAVDASGADVFGALLSAAASAVVLSFTGGASPLQGDGSGENHELSALGWAAEHAAELGADPARLLIAGMHRGGGRAAWLALGTRDNTWPQLCRQLLVHPTFAAPCVVPTDVAGVAPATILSTAAADADGPRYAGALRAAGIEVEELRYRDPVLPDAPQLSELIRSLLVPGRRTDPTRRPPVDTRGDESSSDLHRHATKQTTPPGETP